jgi:Zn-dependent peptidase ImmA (M78 family)
MVEENIFGMRLLAARKQAGLSQDGLVDLLDGRISKTAIARYERGIMEPRPEYVQLLANALKQSMDYFYRPMTISISQIEFRKNESLGLKKQEMIRERIAAYTERYMILENLLNQNTEFDRPLAGNLITSIEDIENCAEQLHIDWNLGLKPLGPVMSMLEEKGIKVLEIEATEKFQGFSAMVEEKYPFIVVRAGDTAERRRLTALHELGHLVLNFDKSLDENIVENYCTSFAAAVLIPRSVVYRELGPYRTDISKKELGIIKDRYGISAIAFILRAGNLGILPKPRMINLIVMARKDKYELHIGSNQLVDHPDRFEQLLASAISEGRVSLTKAAELAQLDLNTLMNNYLNND